jgi:hypothetical protein
MDHFRSTSTADPIILLPSSSSTLGTPVPAKQSPTEESFERETNEAMPAAHAAAAAIMHTQKATPTLMGLASELQMNIIKHILGDYMEDGSISMTHLANFPPVMRTCKHLFKIGKYVWKLIPLYIPGPLGLNSSIEKVRQANGVRAIYGARPRHVKMKVAAWFHYACHSRDIFLQVMTVFMEEYGLQPCSQIVAAFIWGTPHQLRGNETRFSFQDFLRYELRRFPVQPRPVQPGTVPVHLGTVQRRTTKVGGNVSLINMLPIFAWLKFSGITAVKERLTFVLFSPITPTQLPQRVHRLQFFAAITTIVVIVAYSPDVSHIEIKGIGGELDAFISQWQGIPRNIAQWGILNIRSPLPLLDHLCRLPFPYPHGLYMNKYVVPRHGGGANAWPFMIRTQQPVVRKPQDPAIQSDLRDKTRWCQRVWEARFQRYQWEFKA